MAFKAFNPEQLEKAQASSDLFNLDAEVQQLARGLSVRIGSGRNKDETNGVKGAKRAEEPNQAPTELSSVEVAQESESSQGTPKEELRSDGKVSSGAQIENSAESDDEIDLT